MAGVRALIFWLPLAALAAILSPASASAHAVLVASSPEDGDLVPETPKDFRLDFNENVAVMSLRLSGGGQVTRLDAFKANGASVTIEAPPGLPNGTYALSYRVVSEDDHPIAGAMAFAIGEPNGNPTVAPEETDPALAAAIWASRFALYLGLLFGVGGAFARAWLIRETAGRRIAVAGSAVGLIAAAVALASQAADLAGAPLRGVIDPVVWRLAIGTGYAWTVYAAAGALVVALLSLFARGRLAKGLSALALGGLGAALAASGHASVASPQTVMRMSVFVHSAAAAVWIGALFPLFAALGRDRHGAVGGLGRFSAVAPYAVAVLLLAGGVLAVRQVQTVAALWTTDYGRVLSAKLALVGALFVLAAANRWRWTRAAVSGDAGARRSLRRSIAAEAVVGAVILGVVALWRFTPPPRSLESASAAPALAHLQSRAAQADVMVAPGRVGSTDVTVTVMAGDFGPLDAKQVTLVLSKPGAGVAEIRREARKPGDGTWRVDGVQLAAAGRWTLMLEILVTDYDMERLESGLNIRP